MHVRIAIAAALAAAGLAGAHAASAQKLLASYPTLTTHAAQQAAQAALARCQKDGFTVAVAVVDRGGQPLARAARQPRGRAHEPDGDRQGGHRRQLPHRHDGTRGDDAGRQAVERHSRIAERGGRRRRAHDPREGLARRRHRRVGRARAATPTTCARRPASRRSATRSSSSRRAAVAATICRSDGGGSRAQFRAALIAIKRRFRRRGAHPRGPLDCQRAAKRGDETGMRSRAWRAIARVPPSLRAVSAVREEAS